MTQENRTPLSLLAHWGWAALVIVPALLVGTVHPTTRLAVFGAAALLFVLFTIESTRSGRRIGVPLLVWALGGAGIWSIIQAIPVGRTLVGTLSPQSAERIEKVLATVGIDNPWWSLSLDPAASAGGGGRLLLYAGFYLAVARLSRRQERASRFLKAVALLGFIEITIVIANVVLGPTGLFSLFDHPATTSEGFRGTFLNPNHQAGFFNLTAFVFLGLALEAQNIRGRWLWGIGFVASTIGSVLTWSRGAAVVLLLSMGIFLTLKRLGSFLSNARPIIRGIAVLLATATAILALALLEGALNRWNGSTLSPASWGGKTGIWPGTWSMILDNPVAGIGHGAFGPAIAPYNDVAPGITWDFAENGILQALADWGIVPGTAFLITVITGFGILMSQATRIGVGMAAMFGVFALSLQNLWDFSLAVPGVAFPTLAVLGAITGQVRNNGKASNEFKAKLWMIAPVATVVAFVALIMWQAETNDRQTVNTRLGSAVVNTIAKDQRAALMDSARADLRLHAHDPHLITLTAQLMASVGDSTRAANLLDAALVIAPDSYEVLLAQASLAESSGRHDFAAGRIHAIFDKYPKHQREMFKLMSRVEWGPELTLQALGDDQTRFFAFIETIKRAGKTLRAMDLALYKYRSDPSQVEAANVAGSLLIALEKVEKAQTLATHLVTTQPQAHQGYLLWGQILWSEKRYLEAMTMFEEAAKLAPDDIDVEFWILRALAVLEQWTDFDKRADGFARIAKGKRVWEARLHLIMAHKYEQTHNTIKALDELARAERKQPTDPNIPLSRARLLKRIGRHIEANEAYHEVLRLSPGHPEATRELSGNSTIGK